MPNNLYVDDLISGSDSVKLAGTQITEITQPLNKGGFELRKLGSSDASLINSLPENLRENVEAFEFSDEDHLINNHYDTQNNVNVELPEPGSNMYFNNYKNMLERPYAVYADFESSIVPTGLKTRYATTYPTLQASILFARLIIQAIIYMNL